MAWILVAESFDPFANAATEEHLLKSFDAGGEPVIYLWRNDNTIVIGRNQNPLKEINLAAAERDGVKLFRRLSGGGAVYHDLGNLNYSFVSQTSAARPSDYATLAQPIIAFLRSLGVPAEFKGRNDIEIGGRKISGTAQYVYKDRLLHHGTLLFSLNENKLGKYLNVDPDKIRAKGIDSVRKRVTNISEHLPPGLGWDASDFTQALAGWFSRERRAKPIVLAQAARQEIARRAKEHFASWEWNYQNFDPASFFNKKRFPGGSVEVYLTVESGTIRRLTFAGDFLSVRDPGELTRLLIGQKHDPAAVRAILQSVDLPGYFGQIDADQLIEAMFDSGKNP